MYIYVTGATLTSAGGPVCTATQNTRWAAGSRPRTASRGATTTGGENERERAPADLRREAVPSSDTTVGVERERSGGGGGGRVPSPGGDPEARERKVFFNCCERESVVMMNE